MKKLLYPGLVLSCLLLSACAKTSTPEGIRLATFNAAMGLNQAGALAQRLRQPGDPALSALAEIVQRVQPDILILNEFDDLAGFDEADALRRHYLSISQNGQTAIDYTWAYRAPVNTGVDSGLDLDRNGQLADGADAWGFGLFPGQYSMLVLSRYPLDAGKVRTFQNFLWQNLPGAQRPQLPDGSEFYDPQLWQKLRLSSKSHWHLPFTVGEHTLHVLASHPTPPVFDGPEDRNGLRNFDEIRFWAEYIRPDSDWIVDDAGDTGGMGEAAFFVIAGDQNSDPQDGDSHAAAIAQLLEHERLSNRCIPASAGGSEASALQGGANAQQRGDPAHDTSDFSDEVTGNMRLDYLIPSARLNTFGCGVFWPAQSEEGHVLTTFSDHRLVWLDIGFPE